MAAACGRKSLAEQAAPDVAALLASVQAGDAQAFEARLDRGAVRADLRRQLLGVGRANGVEVDGGPSDFALDRRIGPQMLRLVAEGADAPPAAPPTPAQAQALIKPLDKDHVCVRDLSPAQDCLLTFAREPAGWRLTAMPAQPGSAIQIPPPAEKK